MRFRIDVAAQWLFPVPHFAPNAINDQKPRNMCLTADNPQTKGACLNGMANPLLVTRGKGSLSRETKDQCKSRDRMNNFKQPGQN